MIRHLGLVSETSQLSSREVMIVAAALQKQLARDFDPIWEIVATANAFETLEDVPIGCWPIVAMEDIGSGGVAGLHLDDDGQPFGLVNVSDAWSLQASRQALELAVDPFGHALRPGPSVDSVRPGRVEYLVEVCGPCGAWEYGYDVNGVHVSDFYTPDFLLPLGPLKSRFSFTGAVDRPRSILRGGHLTWLDPASGDWWQQVWFGETAELRNLGTLAHSANVREQVQRKMASLRSSGGEEAPLGAAPQILAQVMLRSSHSSAAAARARRLRKLIDALSRRSRARAKGA
jgi:hypothetical protein